MPFARAEMKNFTSDRDFVITTSNPTYPQSNGQSERAIQTVKSLFKKVEVS
jgi:transposase